MSETIWTPERAALALHEAERWLGVQHRNRMCVYPVGIDCLHYVRAIWSAAGIVDDRPLGKYRVETGMFKKSEALLDRLEQILFVERAPLDEPAFGDIVLMKTVPYSAHIAWYGDGYIYHALAQQCVVKSSYRQWRKKVNVLLRATQVGWRNEPNVG